MQNSSIISDFRTIAADIKKDYLGERLIGPTGHSYLVDEHSFQSAYPNFLQSYEFYLLANATINIKEKFPEVEVIGHYHDGNTLAVPRDLEPQVSEFYNSEVIRLGKEVKLTYPQSIEIKQIYDGLKE